MTPADLRDLLEQEIQAWGALRHPSVLQRFVLRNGVGFTGCQRPAQYRRGTPKECFMNAARLLDWTGLTYFEGYACHPRLPIPIHHAWNADAAGRVVDVTFDQPEHCVYIGVQVSEVDLRKQQLRSGIYGVFDDGVTFNTVYMFSRDPELEGIVNAVINRMGVLDEVRQHTGQMD